MSAEAIQMEYPRQEPSAPPAQDLYPKQEPFPSQQEPPVTQFQPVRMNLMPPAPLPTEPYTHNQHKNTVSTSTPTTFLYLSIFTTIFCCFPLSVLALRSSLKAKAAYQANNLGIGKTHARRALKFAIASILSGIVIIACLVALLALQITGEFRLIK